MGEVFLESEISNKVRNAQRTLNQVAAIVRQAEKQLISALRDNDSSAAIHTAGQARFASSDILLDQTIAELQAMVANGGLTFPNVIAVGIGYSGYFITHFEWEEDSGDAVITPKGSISSGDIVDRVKVGNTLKVTKSNMADSDGNGQLGFVGEVASFTGSLGIKFTEGLINFNSTDQPYTDTELIIRVIDDSVRVPDCVGDSLVTATTKITEQGLVVAGAPGTVAAQSPPANTFAEPGSTVTLS